VCCQRRPPCSPLFPYTTLFRSRCAGGGLPDPSAGAVTDEDLSHEAAQLRACAYCAHGPSAQRAAPYHGGGRAVAQLWGGASRRRSEEHTSELQSLAYLVCRLLL